MTRRIRNDQDQEPDQTQQARPQKPAGRAQAAPTPIAAGRLPGIEKPPRPGCTCPKWDDYDGSCHYPAFKDWAWKIHAANGAATAWDEADGKQLWVGYHKFRARAAVESSWKGFHEDTSDYSSGHSAKKWATEPARWPLPVRTPQHPRTAANMAAAAAYRSRYAEDPNVPD